MRNNKKKIEEKIAKGKSIIDFWETKSTKEILQYICFENSHKRKAGANAIIQKRQIEAIDKFNESTTKLGKRQVFLGVVMLILAGIQIFVSYTVNKTGIQIEKTGKDVIEGRKTFVNAIDQVSDEITATASQVNSVASGIKTLMLEYDYKNTDYHPVANDSTVTVAPIKKDKL
ncbi:MAG: hypothetical protein ISS33_02780 [Candidatus Omnitrophica bacterium]|nr:hypothetical protein [Candidatus Omnitrophota bacterium]